LGAELGQSTFYTDSITDLPLLERVGNRRVVNPDPKLRSLAKTRGWSVRDFALR
jgi:phosphoserine phosphatase